MATKCECWILQKRANLCLRVHKAIPKHQVVLCIKSVLVERAEMACHITIERFWISWIDSDCNETVFRDEGILSTTAVLFCKCLCRYIGTYFVKSVVSSVFESCWCLCLMSHHPFFVILAPLASHEFISAKLGRKLKAKTLSKQLNGFLFLFIKWL